MFKCTVQWHFKNIHSVVQPPPPSPELFSSFQLSGFGTNPGSRESHGLPVSPFPSAQWSCYQMPSPLGQFFCCSLLLFSGLILYFDQRASVRLHSPGFCSAKAFIQHHIHFSQRFYKAVIITHSFKMREQHQRHNIPKVIVISEPGFDSRLSDLTYFI